MLKVCCFIPQGQFFMEFKHVLLYTKSGRMSTPIMNREAFNWHHYCLLIIFTDRRGKLGRGNDKWSVTHCQGNCPGRHMKEKPWFLWYGHLEPPEEKFVCFTIGLSWLSFSISLWTADISQLNMSYLEKIYCIQYTFQTVFSNKCVVISWIVKI